MIIFVETTTNMNFEPSPIPGSKKRNLRWIALFLLLGLVLTYWNHFDNSFHFDDFHTIKKNPYIQSLDNIPSFFTDFTKTQSTRPVVKTYRPLVTTANAISYWLGGGYNPFYFHLTIFIGFLLQLLLIFFLFRKILNACYKHRWNIYIAMFAVAWYGFHTANAETINYIISRSDSYSTLFVVMTLTIWALFPKQRKYGLYMIPAILGMFTKEQSAMIAPILLFYILIIEQQLSIPGFLKKKNKKALWQGVKRALPAIIILFIITYIIVFAVRISKEPDYGHTAFQYAITQPWVWLHYFITFIFPYKLSADPDMSVFKTGSDPRLWAGFAFLLLYIWAIIKTSKTAKWRPVSFGLIWFGLALLPTSSIFPLGQISNDHRMFFPFVGLALSGSWTLGILLLKNEKRLLTNKNWKMAIFAIGFFIIAGHAWGTYQRNQVWDSEKTLWKDAVEKSPKNARALMNYGLTLMNENKLQKAKRMYDRAYELNPNYNYLLVNMAILYNSLGKKDSAEYLYKRAIKLTPNHHVPNYYYGRHLFKQNKLQDAHYYASKAVSIVPHYMQARHLMMNILYHQRKQQELRKFARETLEFNNNDELALFYLNKKANYQQQIREYKKKIEKNPTAKNYIQLSLAYYKNKQYKKVIEACREAIKLDPQSSIAYNNMGSAYIALDLPDKAIKYLKEALKINPDFDLAKNNLRQARNKIEEEKIFKKNHSYNEWITLSVEFYQNGQYKSCIRACRRALEIKSQSVEAYNNICSAYNKLGKYKKARDACQKALDINPDMERAKNNLKVSENHIRH